MSDKKTDRTKDTTRPRITRERVVSEAIKLVDDGGLEALTMRALGQECRCDPMVIYRHVRDKDALLDAIRDGIWDEVEIPEEGLPGTWQEQFRQAFTILKNTLGSHPNALPIVFRGTELTGAALRRTEFALGILIEAGFRPVDAMWALDTASCYVLGHVLGETGATEEGISPEAVAESYGSLSPADYPNLAAVMTEGVVMHRGESFERGMDLMISGLEQILAETQEEHASSASG